MNIINISVLGILILIYATIVFSDTYLTLKDRKIEAMKNNSAITETIKVLQEIACDYKVRIIRNEKGTVDEFELPDKRGCVDIDINNLKTQYPIDFDDANPLSHIIIFRVFGRCYVAYAETEMDAWSIVVSKARKESKHLFGRSAYLDRHKI